MSLGHQYSHEEETSGDATPHSTNFIVASTYTRAPCICIVNRDGEILVHRQMPAGPDPFLKAIAPDREDLVVWVEGLFTWSWLADLCAREGMPFVLGHALYLKAIHGGKAKHDTIDAQKIAGLLRGGMLPQASVSPAAMRATRDLLRRRMHLLRKRAGLLGHIQNTKSQDHLPAIGQTIAYKANRDGVAERFPDPAVQKSLEVDLARMDHDDGLLRDRELASLTTAKPHDANTRYLLCPVPGIGAILRLVLLDVRPNIQRFPRVHAFVSYGRLVKCAQASAGQRYGTSGTKRGGRICSGPFPQRPCSGCAALLRVSKSSPAWRNNRVRGKR